MRYAAVGWAKPVPGPERGSACQGGPTYPGRAGDFARMCPPYMLHARAAPLHRRPGIIYGLCGKERHVMIRTALSLVLLAPCTAAAPAQAPAPDSADALYTFHRRDDRHL